MAVSAWVGSAGADEAPAKPFFQVDLSKFVTHTLYEPQMKTPGCDGHYIMSGARLDVGFSGRPFSPSDH